MKVEKGIFRNKSGSYEVRVRINTHYCFRGGIESIEKARAIRGSLGVGDVTLAKKTKKDLPLSLIAARMGIKLT